MPVAPYTRAMRKPSRSIATVLVGTLSLEVVVLGAAHKAQPPHVDTPDFSTLYSLGNAATMMQSTTASTTVINLFDLISLRNV